MADRNEPGGPDPTTEDAGTSQNRAAAPQPSRGRIPSLTPLKPVPAQVETGRTAPGVAAFRPNVTAYWTPAASASHQGQSGFIRIATPVTERPDGVASIIPTGQRSEGEKEGSITAINPSAPGPSVVVAMEADVKKRTNTPIVTGGGAGAGAETQQSDTGSPLAGTSDSGIPSRVAEARSVRIPFRVGDYEVATRIGQGGAGSIYVCRRATSSLVPQPLLTLKVIRQHAQHKEAVVAAFKREARVGALLRHPNASTVLDEGIYEGQPFLILPYHEGVSLASLLTEGTRPPPPVVVTMLIDVLRALEHAWHVTDEEGKPLGLVHGDVSPDNILVGTDGVSRLTDFGSARFTAQPDSGAAHLAFNMAKPAYMSPEQLRGEGLDARSDIFALGIVMWTALTGQKLFAADTYDQTIIRIMRRKIPAPSTLGAPAVLDDVCLQALSRAPEGRFATASAMMDALMAALKGEMVATRDLTGQWVRREMGETLNERRRRIEHMFGDGKTAASASGAPPSKRPVQPAATIQLNRVAVALGAREADVRTLFIPGREPPSHSQALSRRQWYIVTCVSIVTFFLTLAVGNWLSRPSHRPTATGSPAAISGPGADVAGRN